MTLTMALMACLLGYGEVGLWLQKESKKENSWVVMEGNPYKLWIDDYSGETYHKAVKDGLGSCSILFFDCLAYHPSDQKETIESCAVANPPSSKRLSEWVGVWERCTKLEKAFWDMGLEIL